MARLAEAHIEQAKVLKAEGKSARQIAEVLSTTYNVKISQWDVYAALKGTKTTKKPAGKTAKRKYNRHIALSAPTTKENAITDITAILEEIHTGYSSIFKYLRCELIKSRAQVNAMLVSASLPEIDSTIK